MADKVNVDPGTYLVKVGRCPDEWMITVDIGGRVRPSQAWREALGTRIDQGRYNTRSERPSMEWTRIYAPNGMLADGTPYYGRADGA